MTLSNYFYKVKQQYPLTEKQQELYDILGDLILSMPSSI